MLIKNLLTFELLDSIFDLIPKSQSVMQRLIRLLGIVVLVLICSSCEFFYLDRCMDCSRIIKVNGVVVDTIKIKETLCGEELVEAMKIFPLDRDTVWFCEN